MNRRLMTIGASAISIATAAAVAMLGIAAPAADARTRRAVPTVTTSPCKGDLVKAKVHDAAVRREQTLTDLVNRLSARKDPYAMNAGQSTALQMPSPA